MTVTFVGATSGNSGTATDTSQPTSFHANWAADDVAVLFVGFGGNSITVNSGMTDWTAISGFSNPQTQGTSSRAYAFYRRLQGGDTAPTIGYSGSITGGWTMLIFRGALLSGTPVGQAGASNAAASTVNIASLTGVLADSMLAVLLHNRVPTGTAIPGTWSPDADYTQDASSIHATNRNTATAQNVRYGSSYRAIAANGNYGGDTFTSDTSGSIISLHVEVLAEATEQTVTLDQVTETDTAQSLTVVDPILVGVSQVSETDTAQSLTVIDPKLITLDQVSETDTAQTLTVSVTDVVALAQVTETETAQSLTVVDPILGQVAQVTETDTARGLTVVDPAIIALAQVTETDTAQAFTLSQGEAPAEPETFNDNFQPKTSSRWAAAFLTTTDGAGNDADPRVDLDECIGQRQATYKFVLVDGIDGIIKGEITPARGDGAPTMSHDTSRTVKRTVTPVLLQPSDVDRVDPVRDRIHISMVFPGADSDSSDLEFPLGRFMFSDFTRVPTAGGTWASCGLLDEMFMVDVPLESSFSISPSDVIGDLIESADATIRRLLSKMNILIAAESTSYYSAGSWPIGTRGGQVVNDVAQVGDYLSPWFGNDHRLHLKRVFDPADEVATFNWDARKFVLRNSITLPSDYLSSPNRILVISNDAVSGGEAQLSRRQVYGSYDIPASAPHSQVNRGFVYQETYSLPVNTISQANAVARVIGQRTLNVDRVELSTPPDPRHDAYDVIRWNDTNWLELGWSMPLTEGAEMQHVLRKAYA